MGTMNEKDTQTSCQLQSLPSRSSQIMFPDGEPHGRILVVDNSASALRLVTRLLVQSGHTVFSTTDAKRTIGLMADTRPDIVILDVVMPGVSGFELCRTLKQQALTVLTPVLLITALQDHESRLQGIKAGADDFLTKPISGPELQARVRSLLRLKRYTDDLESAESIIVSLALTVEARDAGTNGHCQRLAAYATRLGQTLRLEERDLDALERGGFLHDVGKIGIPDAILLKPGRLTADEYQVMKQHTIIGDRLCGELRSLAPVRPIVRHHHERLDGTGYPDGLSGETIPLLAQIMSVVDVFDAITSVRPYQRARPPAEALAELEGEVARGWKRHDLVQAFSTLIRDDRTFTTERPDSPWRAASVPS